MTDQQQQKGYEATDPTLDQQQPVKPSGPEPDCVISNAIDPNLNGPVWFKYPTVFEEVHIETRIVEMSMTGRKQQLDPYLLTGPGQRLVTAIANLEFGIRRAPRGFFVIPDNYDRPVLSPGRVGGLDRDLLFKLYDVFVVWKSTFRGDALSNAGIAPADYGVVLSSKSIRDAQRNDTDATPSGPDSEARPQEPG